MVNLIQALTKFNIENRRYIGNKTKLTDWIMTIIQSYAIDAQTFCDIFAGTGTVANCAIPLYDKVIINDLLFSNNVIYEAFFGNGEYDEEKLSEIISDFNKANPKEENWFSESYGDKYFSAPIARKIGYIREKVESLKPLLTIKEYNILLASLIYSMDKIANTVGHYEAYIKKNIDSKPFILKMISAQCCNNVDIYRSDGNKLAKEIKTDIVYIDPPYNSRQYSRFYHVYETLVKWDKPELFGVARKPAPENLSKYCTSGALTTFQDLINSIDAKYIAVSYNNTYTSKSKSSQNKIKLEDILSVLQKKGNTEVFYKAIQCL